MARSSTWLMSAGYHLLAWAALFAGWYYFRVGDFPNQQLAVEITLVKVLSLAILVYSTNYFLIPKLLYKKKYILFGLLYLVWIFLLGSLKIFVNEKILSPYFRAASVFSDFKERVYDNIIPLFLLTSTAATIKLLVDFVKSQRKLTETSKEKSETELKFLKSQINPHFLFNSLNTVYFLIDKQNKDARQTLLQFSDLLRYQLYDCNADMVDIEREVAYLKDYCHLQQLRKDSSYVVDIKTENVAGFRIVPLLLIPFLENAFKHISHFSDKKNFVNVRICRKENRFQFKVSNSKEDAQSNIKLRSGIGLANVKRRLELIYPGRYSLAIDDRDGIYDVELELEIH
ncbi:MAG: sensor histidine kinase [Chitinophagales bacterium]